MLIADNKKQKEQFWSFKIGFVFFRSVTNYIYMSLNLGEQLFEA
jgi:hypothetical protein